MTDLGLLDSLRTWVTEHEDDLDGHDISVELDTSHAESAKPAVSLAIDSSEVVAQFTLWVTGEAEVEYAEVATGVVHSEHHELHSTEGLFEVLQQLRNRLLR